VIKLHDFQAASVEWAERTLPQLNRRSVVIQAPTGAGKTIIGDALKPDLWIAPGDDLVRQTRERCSAEVYTTQLLARWIKDGKPLPRARRAVLDEGRWTVAEKWGEIPRRLLAQGTELVILDATPCTATGRGLGSVADALHQSISVKQCIDRGFLVPFHLFGPSSELDAMAAPRSRTPVDACLAPVLWTLAYEQAGWIRPGARALWFCETQAHGEGVAAAFRQAGRGAELICDKTPRERRIELLGSQGSPGALARGELQVLTCPELLRQGIDIPEVEVVGFARRVGSFPLRQQGLGRGLRLAPWIGKQRLVAFDLYGTANRPEMGLPDRDVVWSLEGDACRPALSALPPCRCCKACLAWWPGDGACPACGAVAPPRPLPRTKATDLGEMFAARTNAEKADDLARWTEEAYRSAVRRGLRGKDFQKACWSAAHKWQSLYKSERPPFAEVARLVRAIERRGKQTSIPGVQ